MTGGRLGPAVGRRTVTLSKTAVAARVSSWLVTARPTYAASVIGTVSRANEVQVRPSIDRNASKVDPDRTSRIHAVVGLGPPPSLSLNPPVSMRRWNA